MPDRLVSVGGEWIPEASVRSDRLKRERAGRPGYELKFGVEVDGDGNCLFRSLSELLPAKPPHANIRQSIVDHVLRFPHRFEETMEHPADDNESLQKYADKMRSDGSGVSLAEWGGDLEIHAAADLYGVVIRVWMLSNSDMMNVSDRAIMARAFFPEPLTHSDLPKQAGYPLNELQLVNTNYDMATRSHFTPAYLRISTASDREMDKSQLPDIRLPKEAKAAAAARARRRQEHDLAAATEARRAAYEKSDPSYAPSGRTKHQLDDAINELEMVLLALDVDDVQNRAGYNQRIQRLKDLRDGVA